eukprot:13216019-Heterocapsa_arctica.AAC.1
MPFCLKSLRRSTCVAGGTPLRLTPSAHRRSLQTNKQNKKGEQTNYIYTYLGLSGAMGGAGKSGGKGKGDATEALAF